MDARPPLSAFFTVFGLPATVTLPDAAPISTTALWLPPTSVAELTGVLVPQGQFLAVCDLKKTEVPTLPRGTLITGACLATGASATWCVDRILYEDAEVLRAVVLKLEA